MSKFLAELVMPIFTSMGASSNDVYSTVDSLIGYIYAILILLLVAVGVMIGAHWFAKKGDRHVVRWSAALSFLLVTAIIVNYICFGPMYTTVSSALADPYNLSDETVTNSKSIVQEVEMILLV